MSTTIFDTIITEDDSLLPKCNKVTAKYNVNSGFLFRLRYRFMFQCAYLPPSDNNNNNRQEWATPLIFTAYVPDSGFSSYESVKQLVSNKFARVGMPEDEQIRTINSIRAFTRIHRRERDDEVVPMLLDIQIVTMLEDEEAAVNRIMARSVDEIKTVPAAEWSIQALEKLRVLNGGECCAVCLDELLLGTEVLGMPCKHVFHGDCIVPWLRTMHVCPVCRHAMPLD